MKDSARETGPQQTVRLAIDCLTGDVLTAEALQALPEMEFTKLRREAMQARVDRRAGGSGERFRCAICECPLFLSRRIVGNQNRWFVHDGRHGDKANGCPWFEGRHLAPEQIKALIYRGQQEGREHREMKDFIARWLGQNPMVQDVCIEKTTFSEVVKGEWRRPDIRCTYRGLPIVFEIQLSYTFLSDVIARDAFYRREKTFVIWVFSKFDICRAAVADEAFFNRRNLFVLDAQAREVTEIRSALSFSGIHQVPHLVAPHSWYDSWATQPVGLDDLKFPQDTYRPYFFDYEARRQEIETAWIDASREKEKRRWNDDVEAYRAAATRLLNVNAHGDGERKALLEVVDRLEGNGYWHPGYGGLRTPYFFGYHGVLSVLMSIKEGRPISYSPTLSVFQVIEAGLRSGSRVGKHANAVLYLWAYKIYRPQVTQKNKRWLSNYAHEVKRSLENREATYLRDTSLDETIELIFPELQELLAGPFGTRLMFSDEDTSDTSR